MASPMTSAVEASSVRLQTMADSTLRLTVDIEPRFANQAFQLFGKVGTPVALAALKSAKSEPEPEKPKGGILSQWAALRCQEPAFQKWLSQTYPDTFYKVPRGSATEVAAHIVRALCGVQSRAELDNDMSAQANFRRLVVGPWQKHCLATGATA